MSLPSNYTGGLAQAAARKQVALIRESQSEYERTGKVVPRPRVTDAPTPRSAHAAKFERRYGYKISDLAKVRRDFPDTDVAGILSKGRAAYASSGSRPNTTPEAWAKARLASVLTGGKALRVDKDLVGSQSLARIRA
jgi:hypothetical protein